MANFTTHIVVGTVVSGSLATLTLAADVIAPQNLVAVTMAGALGSVLPDIDLKDSRPSRALFSGLAIFFSFVVLFHFAPQLSIAEMWVIWVGTLLFVRYGLHNLFHHYAVHRGIWHSIVAGVVCALATAIVFYYGFGRPDGVAWLAAGFLFIGYLTHLILDEIGAPPRPLGEDDDLGVGEIREGIQRNALQAGPASQSQERREQQHEGGLGGRGCDEPRDPADALRTRQSQRLHLGHDLLVHATVVLVVFAARAALGQRRLHAQVLEHGLR